MSPENQKIRVTELVKMKARGERIAVLTAYDASMARILDQAGVDVLLVGDSLAMVVMGEETTLPVTLDVMIHHSRAVARGARRALVVADMPFLTYQVNADEAVRNAGRLMQETGVSAVKLEGGVHMAATIRRIVDAGIPVMGHIGLTPQSVHQLGGYRAVGKASEEAAQLMEDAIAIERAGVFSMVLECVPAELAAEISSRLTVPTIGIGSGAGCDGQVLVCYDAFGLYGGATPRFVKQYANLGGQMADAAGVYVDEVRRQAFPGPEHSIYTKKG